MPLPTSTYHGPGPGNVYIPDERFRKSPGATVMMQIEFSKNPADFAVNKYTQLVLGSTDQGMYLILDTDEAVRVVNLEDFEWPDGNDAPKGQARKLRWGNFRTNRFAYPWNLGYKTRNNAAGSWDIEGANSRMSATQAMTARTYGAITAMSVAADWGDNTSATVDALLSLTGASWVTSATTDLFIQRSFHTVVESILKSTGGVISVERGEISCVIGPDTAHKMSRTAEIREYIKNHEAAISYWENTGIFTAYNLPPKMYGVNMIVEDSVRISTRDGAATTTRNFMPGNGAWFVSRMGGDRGFTGGIQGAPTFSTVVGFIHEDMTVETKNDDDNRRVDGRVVDDYDYVLAAPISGWYVQDITT